METLAETYAKAYPWTLQIRINGGTFDVRRLSNADVSALMRAASLPAGERAEFFSALFLDGSPRCEWDDAEASAVVSILLNYYLALLRQEVGTEAAEPAAEPAAGPPEGSRPLRWSEVVLMLKEVAPGTPLCELWRTPADATVRMIGDAARLRTYLAGAAGGPASGQEPMGPRSRRRPDGTIVETIGGENAMAQLDQFMIRTGGRTTPKIPPKAPGLE